MIWIRWFLISVLLVGLPTFSGCGQSSLPNATDEEVKNAEDDRKANLAAEDENEREFMKTKKKGK